MAAPSRKKLCCQYKCGPARKSKLFSRSACAKYTLAAKGNAQNGSVSAAQEAMILEDGKAATTPLLTIVVVFAVRLAVLDTRDLRILNLNQRVVIQPHIILHPCMPILQYGFQRYTYLSKQPHAIFLDTSVCNLEAQCRTPG